MPIRTLSLRRDVLADLSADELRDLAAGEPTGRPTGQRITCPLTDCVQPSNQIYCWAETFPNCPSGMC